MNGNVWEWTRSLDADYPYPTSDKERSAREDLTAGDSQHRVLRGGLYGFSDLHVRCAVRATNGPDARDDFIGFRVVVSPSPLISVGSDLLIPDP